MNEQFPNFKQHESYQQATGAVTHLAQDILSRINQEEHIDPEEREMIVDVLTFAIEAEKDLIVQRDRVERLQSLSTIDEVTGLGNAQAFNQAFLRAVSAATRYGDPGIVMRVEIANLDQVMQTYGSLACDAMLRSISQRLQCEIRNSDLASRWQNDEFALLLERCPLVFAAPKAERITEALEGLRVHFDGHTLTTQVVVGYAPFGAGSTLATAMSAADRILYEAKINAKLN